MSIFNPTVPDTQDPNWLGWSKSITQPEGNKSTALAIGAVSEGVGDALKLADTSMKSIIEDEIYDKAKSQQTDYNNRLAAADDAVRNARLNPSASPNASGVASNTGAALQGDQNILNTSTSTPIPSDLKSLPEVSEMLGAARANGRISPTDYAARLDMLAKDFRSRYPGYKEYIDETFKKVTGVDPANKYMESVLGDLNSFATNQNAVMTKIDTELAKPEVLGSPEGRAALAARRAGKITDMPTLLAMIQPAYQRKYQYEENQRVTTDVENDQKLKAIRYDQAANGYAAGYVRSSISQIVLGPNRQKLEDYLEAHKPGSGAPLSDPEWANLGQVMNAERTTAYNSIINQLSMPGPIDPKTGKPSLSFVDQRGMEAAKALTNNHMAWYDNQLSAITSKDLGLMHTSATALESQTNWAARELVGKVPLLGLVKVGNTLGGPQFAASAAITGIVNGLDPVSKTTLSNSYLMLKVQPGLRVYKDMPAPNGQVFTTRDILEKTNTPPNPNDPSPPPPTSPAANKAATQLAPAMVLDPKQPDEVKINAAKGIYSKGYLDLIKGSDKKLEAYLGAYSSDMIKEVKRLSPNDVWPMMKRQGAKEFSSQLFQGEVEVLNSIPDNKDMHITWDDKNHEFGLDVGNHKNVHLMDYAGVEQAVRGTSMIDRGNPAIAIVQRAGAAINRINMGLKPIAEMYKADGRDPNEFLPGLLKAADIKPNTLPAKMIDPFRVRALQYNEENAPSSGALDEFVKNPFQGVPTPRPLETNAPASLSAAPRGTPAATVPKKTRNQTNYGVDEESFNSRFNGYNR